MINCEDCKFWGEKAFIGREHRRCTNKDLLARGECEPGDMFQGLPGIATLGDFACNQGMKR